MTIHEHEGDDIDDEVQPSYFFGVPTKTILDNVDGCGNWVITLGLTCLILAPILLLDKTGSGHTGELAADTAAVLLSVGFFSCAAGIACKATECCVEYEDDMSEPQMVGMV